MSLPFFALPFLRVGLGVGGAVGTGAAVGFMLPLLRVGLGVGRGVGTGAAVGFLVRVGLGVGRGVGAGGDVGAGAAVGFFVPFNKRTRLDSNSSESDPSTPLFHSSRTRRPRLSLPFFALPFLRVGLGVGGAVGTGAAVGFMLPLLRVGLGVGRGVGTGAAVGFLVRVGLGVGRGVGAGGDVGAGAAVGFFVPFNKRTRFDPNSSDSSNILPLP